MHLGFLKSQLTFVYMLKLNKWHGGLAGQRAQISLLCVRLSSGGKIYMLHQHLEYQVFGGTGTEDVNSVQAPSSGRFSQLIN